MVEAIKIHNRSFKPRLKSISRWNIPASTQRELFRFLDELALGKVNRGRKISEARQVKYLDMLRVSLEFFNKSTRRLNIKDIEVFEKALSSNAIQSRIKNTDYAHSTKVDIRKALKIFLRWRLGQAKAIELAGWLDTHDRFKTPDYLKETEVEKLLRKCRTAEQRYVIAVLFDSGARAEEFINIRYEDTHLPEGQENYVKIALRQEFSKTLGRTISLYWRHSKEAVKDYLAERIAQGIKPSEPVFNGTYDSLRMFLRRLGLAVLKRPVHPHLFRHSSATHYATQLNRQELCYRYGWKFSSDMPDVYISRAGMENKNLDQKFTNTELGLLKDQVVKLEYEAKRKDETIQELKGLVNTIQLNLDDVYAILKRKPSIGAMQAAVERKRIAPSASS